MLFKLHERSRKKLPASKWAQEIWAVGYIWVPSRGLHHPHPHVKWSHGLLGHWTELRKPNLNYWATLLSQYLGSSAMIRIVGQHRRITSVQHPGTRLVWEKFGNYRRWKCQRTMLVLSIYCPMTMRLPESQTDVIKMKLDHSSVCRLHWLVPRFWNHREMNCINAVRCDLMAANTARKLKTSDYYKGKVDESRAFLNWS